MESYVKDGKVRINGREAKVGDIVDPLKDEVRLKGKLISRRALNEKPILIALHKPRGVVTSAKDPEGRTTVMDFLPKKYKVFPVGRLDFNSEGLILLTNDGDLANRITHPRYEVPKIYDVKIRGKFNTKKLDHIRRGVKTPTEKMKAAEILECREVSKSGIEKYQIRVRIAEGKNHHLRRLFESLGCRVTRIKRVSVGNISLRGVPHGEFRIVPDSKVRNLKKSVGLAA